MSIGNKGLYPGDTKYQVLEAVVDLYDENRTSPTMEQIRMRVGLSGRSGVHFHLNDLKDMGLVSQSSHRYKTIKPTPKGFKYVNKMKDLFSQHQENLF